MAIELRRLLWEQPIFSTKAHVFHIDPATKKNWIPSSGGSISVSFYFDSTRNTYRIISVDGTKAVINSTMGPNMSFTKTSQKFGQWSDPRANTVYGLGFPSEAELNKFALQFEEVRDLTKSAGGGGPGGPSKGGLPLSALPPAGPGQYQQQPMPPSSVPAPVPVSVAAPGYQNAVGLPGAPPLHHGQPAMPPYPNGDQEPPPMGRPPLMSSGAMDSINVNQNHNQQQRASTVAGSGPGAAGDPTSQLKYENDRLKLALAQSSTNGKKWEAELQTLKNNNARLTTALQESTSNVEEWKKQLAAYKEENARLKKRISEVEKSQAGAESAASLQKDLSDAMSQLQIVEGQRNRSEENSQAYKAQLEKVQQEKKASDDQHQSLDMENRRLKDDLRLRTAELQQSRSLESQYSTTVRNASEQLGAKIADLQTVHTLLRQLQS